MRTLEAFLSVMEQQSEIDAAERARLSRIWPAADAAAEQIAAALPTAPWWSRKRRRLLFLTVCEQLDQRQETGELTDEQSQLVLALLRARDAGYRACEATFLASAGTAEPVRSITAGQLLFAVGFDRSRHR